MLKSIVLSLLTVGLFVGFGNHANASSLPSSTESSIETSSEIMIQSSQKYYTQIVYFSKSEFPTASQIPNTLKVEIRDSSGKWAGILTKQRVESFNQSQWKVTYSGILQNTLYIPL